MSGISDPCSHVQSRTSADPDVIYVGYRRRGRAIVKNQSDQEQLTPERSLALASHSPSGFEWGYGGSGPAQLALALLLDYTDDEEEGTGGVQGVQDRSGEPARVYRT